MVLLEKPLRLLESFRLFDTIWLHRVRVFHFGILLRCVSLLLVLRFFLGFKLGSLLSCGFLFYLQACLSFLFKLVIVSLDDGTCRELDVFVLGNVLGFGGVFALFIEPILRSLVLAYIEYRGKVKLTSVLSSFSLIASFSASLAKSAYLSSMAPLSS